MVVMALVKGLVFNQDLWNFIISEMSIIYTYIFFKEDAMIS